MTFKFCTDPRPAYTDLQADNLDVTDVLPSNALKTYTSDFQGRNAAKPIAVNSTLIIPPYNPNFQEEAGKLRRQALSYAINRDEICKVVFNGTRTPATEVTAPVLHSFRHRTWKGSRRRCPLITTLPAKLLQRLS